MAFDRESLRRAAKAAAEREQASRPPGIAGLVSGLHRGELAEFVTIEATALPPVPLRADSAVGIVVAAPGPNRTWVPWGLVVWSWPDGIILRRERLPPGVATPIPVASDLDAFTRSCASAEAHLAGDPGAATDLVGLYRRLVGDAGVSFLAAAFPGARELWEAE